MDSSQSPLSAVLDNLYTRYLALQQSVNQVLQAAVGDSSRINLQVNAVDNFTHALNLVSTSQLAFRNRLNLL